MASSIAKLKLTNYKRFKQFEFIPNKRTNIIVGDNEAGKSTILEAIDEVMYLLETPRGGSNED